jgi:hypothetical protein
MPREEKGECAMSMDVEIYAAVLRRLAEADHGWGKPYDFPDLYVLDHAVPGVENSGAQADLDSPAPEYTFDEALKSALRAKLADLPPLTFVHSVDDVYDASRPGPNQVRGGGAFIALGSVQGDEQTAVVGAMFYGGHRWARWIRYRVERIADTWSIASSDVLGIS